MSVDVDVVVVGAGPAGSCAATVLARAGHSVVLVERGAFPGAKNMYGGVVYPRILDQLHPEWWDEAPVQRWITRRSTMILTDDQALTVDFRTASWGRPPYNGATAYRPDWDHWLAVEGRSRRCAPRLLDHRHRIAARRAWRRGGRHHRSPRRRHHRPGRDLLRRREQLPRQGGRAVRPGRRGELHARREGDARPAEGRDRRALRGARTARASTSRSSAAPAGVNGGGFVYTNLDTVSVGVVLKLPEARRAAAAARGDHRRSQASPGDRSARRGRRGQGVLGARDPRGRSVDDAEDDRRRPARRRRRGGDVPRRGDLARRGELRDGERHVRRRGRGRGAARRRHVGRRARRLRTTARRHVRAARPPQAAPGPVARPVRPGAAPLSGR